MPAPKDKRLTSPKQSATGRTAGISTHGSDLVNGNGASQLGFVGDAYRNVITAPKIEAPPTFVPPTSAPVTAPAIPAPPSTVIAPPATTIPIPATPPMATPAPATPAASTSSNPATCTGPATLKETNSQVQGNTRILTYQVGTCVLPGYKYVLQIFERPVTITAGASDTPDSIAGNMVSTINDMNAAAWSTTGSAPPAGTAGFPPWGRALGGGQFTITLPQNTNPNSSASGTAPAQTAPVTTAPPVTTPVTTAPVSGSSATVNTGTTPAQSASPLPPVANAGPSQTITLPTNTAILDGSGSTDPQDSQLTYNWQLVSGPNTPNIASATGAQVFLNGLIPGSYIFKLSVTNAVGLENDTTTSITVLPAPTGATTLNSGVTTLNTGTVIATAPTDGSDISPYGSASVGGGGGGGGDSTDGSDSGTPITVEGFWGRTWDFTKSHWWLLAIAAGAVALILTHQNEED